MQTSVLPARRLGLPDARWAAELLADAYAAGPAAPWPAGDVQLARPWMQLLVSYALRAGCVYASPGGQAVAVWLPAGAAALSWGQLLRRGQWAASLQLGWHPFWQLMRWRRRQDHTRRQALPAPHHHLLALGVRPAGQHRGEGRALLRASLVAVGGRYLPCYAEAHTVRAVQFSQRLGFEVAAYTEASAGPAAGAGWGLVRPAAPV